MTSRCEQMYGAEFCQNVKRYKVADFSVPSQFVERKEYTSSVERDDQRIGEHIASQKRQAPGAMPLRVTRPLKPTLTDLTATQVDKARMVKASRVAYEESFAAAQAYLDESGIPYDIDTALSSSESLVLIGDDGVKIAYRGTKIENVSDVSTDAMIAAGVEEHHPQLKSAEEQLRLVTDKYGAPNELLGYSYGGTKAMTLGDKVGIDTTTFNPFLGKNLVVSRASEANHTILRTTEDFASLGIGLARGKENWSVDSIHPHQDKLNPLEAHELENFSETSTRRPGHTETMLRSVQRQGQRAGEMELIDAIKTAQEEGNTFTQFVHEFNGGTGSDTTPDGSSLAGSRMHRESKWAKYWEETKNEAGSSSSAFTPQEEAHFDSITDAEATYEPAIRPKERQALQQASPGKRSQAIAKEHEKLQALAEAVDAHTEPYKASANILKRAIHPTNLATGLAGGLGAAAIMDDVIDKDHTIAEVPREGIEGAIAGATTEMGVAALAGTALTAGTMGVGAVAGGASYLAGNETNKLVTGGLQGAGVDATASEAIGAATGGAVGGGVAAGTAIGGAALMGAEIGEFGGPIGALAGAGVGTVVGLGGWLLGKAFGE